VSWSTPKAFVFIYGGASSLKEEYSVRKTLSGELEFLNTMFTCVVVVLIKE
jgi:hypothetical protein